MTFAGISRSAPSFRTVLVVSALLRVALILYSEWHDAHSVVKYTDVDYRVFSDATRFVLNPEPGNRAQGPLGKWVNIGDPYTRETYRYTPLLALLLAPNEWIHGSFGKYLFAGCDILAGVLMHKLLVSVILPRTMTPRDETQAGHDASPNAPERRSPKAQGVDRPDPADNARDRPAADAEAIARRATILASVHLLDPFVFSISTRGSSESVLLLLVLLTLFCALRGRWAATALLLGLSTHWKIYPVIYGAACVGVIGAEGDSGVEIEEGQGRWAAARRYFKTIVNARTARFALLSAGTFFALGAAMYLIWGYPFLYETYLYHLHRLDYRHNFSPYFYQIYLAYPGAGGPEPSELPLWRRVVRSPFTSFAPQMTLALGAGLLFGRRPEHLPFAWFVQTATFVLFNKVCTSQYFLWYLVFIPLLIPRLSITPLRGLLYLGIWFGVQALWLSQAYKLEFLGEPVFERVWVCSLIYVAGHSWVLGELMKSYVLK
ncbi:glycosyltransferase family 50 protein [Dentipellis sp. KUC8613]|nr:glycosyltransferase family 50 protein [Dentipellis sp. KUC8613]